ncbi:TPA: DoxX family protein [Serratia marcescens]|nr:DoxX family protein [Serratia marcescens]
MVKSLNAAFTRLFDRPDAGKLALRLTFGGLMLFHGVAKIQHGVGWIAGALQEQGLPAFIAYGVYVGEILAPILIILGLFTRPSALVYAFTLVVAFLMVGTGKVFTVTDVGAWGIENELVFFMGGLAILLLGSGKYAIARNEAYR